VAQLDTEMDVMPNEIEMDEWNELSPRQQDMVEHTLEVVDEYGDYDQGSGANGAHYFDGSKNVFKSENIMCGNCIFYNEEIQKCLVVSGNIDPEGLCKLWVIPEEEMAETTAQETEEDMTEKRDYNAKERQHAASTGAALPDGSFPINNAQDLHNAIRLYGQAKNPDAAKAHIKARAASLGLTGELPDSWKTTNKSIWSDAFSPLGVNKIG
jgi:hypothetical protein